MPSIKARELNRVLIMEAEHDIINNRKTPPEDNRQIEGS